MARILDCVGLGIAAVGNELFTESVEKVYVMAKVHHSNSSPYPDLSSRALTRDPECGDCLALMRLISGCPDLSRDMTLSESWRLIICILPLMGVFQQALQVIKFLKYGCAEYA